jgi:hypothetical protein
MKNSRTVLLVVLATACGCHAVHRSSDVGAYIQAKGRYDALTKGGLSREGVDTALKDLERRMRRILGPESFPGWKESFNLTWLPCCDPGGWVLDGMFLSDTISHASMVITAPGILGAWLAQIGQKTPDPLIALSGEDALTWVFDDNGHVYPFADLRSKSTPHEVFLAALVDRTNGDPMSPDEVLVGVNAGRRIYVVVAPAVARIDLTSQCGPAWRAEYLPCFRRLVTSHPDFPKLVDQARALAALVTPRR